MADDKRTKASLAADLLLAEQRAERAEAERDEYRELLRQGDIDGEALAISECTAALDALDALVKRRSDQDRYFVGAAGIDPYDVEHVSVWRVLRYLHTRYGLPDPRVKVEELSRQRDEALSELNVLRHRLGEAAEHLRGHEHG